jgi:hypothetical protein
MTPATLEQPLFSMSFGRPRGGLALPGSESPPPAPGDSGRFTLDAMLVGAWEDLRSGQTAACPVCDGVLEPRFAAGPRPVAGRCRDCGSTLS